MDRKSRVLLVSPALQALESDRHALEAGDLEVVTATQASEAATRLGETAFDLIIVDIGLSNPSACEFLDKLRKVLPGLGRAIWEISPQPAIDWRELINQAEPCAVFGRTLDPSRILEVIARRSFLFGAAIGLSESEASRGSAATKDLSAREWFRTLRRKNRRLELDRTEPDLTLEVSRVLDLLFEDTEIRLPVLPELAEEVRQLVDRRDVSFQRVVQTVSLDPGMSARILEVANSVMYATRTRIRNLQQAVSRIGMRETRNILLAVTVENLFKCSDERLATIMKRLWTHSLACAYANELLAAELHIEGSKDLFLMGLLHDVGKLLIIRLVQQGYGRRIWSRDEITQEILGALFDARHNVLGARLMERWNYDESFQNVAYLHNTPQGIHLREDSVVLTYYANLLTRKVGLSFHPYPEDDDPLADLDLAQALNMPPDLRERVEESMRAAVDRIHRSYA